MVELVNGESRAGGLVEDALQIVAPALLARHSLQQRHDRGLLGQRGDLGFWSLRESDHRACLRILQPCGGHSRVRLRFGRICSCQKLRTFVSKQVSK